VIPSLVELRVAGRRLCWFLIALARALFYWCCPVSFFSDPSHSIWLDSVIPQGEMEPLVVAHGQEAPSQSSIQDRGTEHESLLEVRDIEMLSRDKTL